MRAQAKQASEEAEQLATTRAKVAVQMVEKQARITALEVECTTLKQVRTGNYSFQYSPSLIS